MKKFESVIYVNYSPYENSGKILDYLLENFEYVFLFSLGFHNIKKKGEPNKLSIYRNGEVQKEFSLFQLWMPQFLFFISLPVRSLITIIELIYYAYILRLKYGKTDIFFSVNAFICSIGIIIKKLGLVTRTVFWVWDYYPPTHKSKIIFLVRRIYWYFDKWSTVYSDKVLFVNNRLLDLRKKIDVLPKSSKFPVVPIGTDIFKVRIEPKKKLILGFIGVVKKSQGLDVVFDNSKEIAKNFPDARFEIIGSGPDEAYFRHQAKSSPLNITFHGYLEGETFNNVLRECTIGIAPYQPDPSNVAYFGDAGKVKRYLSLGLPVIITDVFEFSKKVKKNRAGIVIRYGNSKDLLEGIRKILKNYRTYQKNALNLSRTLYYKKIYRKMFKF